MMSQQQQQSLFFRTDETRFQGLPEFEYTPHYINLPSSAEYHMAYIDETTENYSSDNDKSHTFLCLHGVPTYSFLFRKMIPILLKSNNYHNLGVRVVAPDFIGWGRSDKPLNPNVHR